MELCGVGEGWYMHLHFCISIEHYYKCTLLYLQIMIEIDRVYIESTSLYRLVTSNVPEATTAPLYLLSGCGTTWYVRKASGTSSSDTSSRKR